MEGLAAYMEIVTCISGVSRCIYGDVNVHQKQKNGTDAHQENRTPNVEGRKKTIADGLKFSEFC
jgi:hypothetical protein